MRQHGAPCDSEMPGAQARLEEPPEWAEGWFLFFSLNHPDSSNQQFIPFMLALQQDPTATEVFTHVLIQ